MNVDSQDVVPTKEDANGISFQEESYFGPRTRDSKDESINEERTYTYQSLVV